MVQSRKTTVSLGSKSSRAADNQKPLLITSGAGGLGLNITAASVVVQMEPWFNKNVEMQAWARCVRQGQTRLVKIYKLVATACEADDYIQQVQERKHSLNHEIMEVLVRRDDDKIIIPGSVESD